MSATKLLQVAGMLIKPEATYNAGGTLSAATDGVQLAEIASFKPSWADDGSRKFNVAAPRPEKKVGKSGRTVQGTAKTRVKGAGAAYTASVLPADFHTLMRISGHSAVLSGGAGLEKYTYAPISGAYPSGVAECYYRGQKYLFQGLFGDAKISAKAGEIAMLEVDLMGTAPTTFTDAAVPAITYQHTVLPPKFEAVGLSIGSFLLGVLRSMEWGTKWNRVASLNANGGAGAAAHAGYSMIDCEPYLKLTVEATPLVASPFHTAGGLDPYRLEELASTLGLGFGWGAQQYNQLAFSAPQAQLADFDEGDDSGQATWDLTFALPPSTPAALDSYTWVQK